MRFTRLDDGLDVRMKEKEASRMTVPPAPHPAHILGNLLVLITMDALYNSVIPW